MRLDEALELLPEDGGPDLLVMELATGGERTIDGIADGERVVLGHPKTREAMRAGLAMYFVTLDDDELMTTADLLVEELEEAARIQRDDLVPLATKPVLKVSLFLLPFGIAKTARDRCASNDDAGIRREHQVRQSRHRLHSFQDSTDIFFKHLHKLMPLADGLV